MNKDLKSLQTAQEYEDALAEFALLWGAVTGTPRGERLDALATLIDAYEARQYPLGQQDQPS